VNVDSIFSILKALCRNVTVEQGYDFRSLARITPGFVGADLEALKTKAAGTTLERFRVEKTELVIILYRKW